VWLRRHDAGYGRQIIATPAGPLALSFGYESRPLDFSLTLVKFTRGVNPGGMGNASYASKVQLLDARRGIDQVREISMNEPLTHDHFTFYQASYQESKGPAVSMLSVAYDPGRPLKYAGSLMTCLGIVWMFVARTVWAQKLRRLIVGAP
jgi:hypothetical protein